MITIRARNVHQIIPQALQTLVGKSKLRTTRNGLAIVMNEPVTSVYERPNERVIFYPQRDANPFFHLMESLWMLAGRNDVGFVAEYAPNMKTFSDDGVTFHGAYGYRWRNLFGFDQVEEIINILSNNTEDRRCVLQMWDARSDLGQKGKDFPCNLMAVFQVANDGRLDMTVYNRSNDMVWGAYGANAVHFSVLQEFIAAATGIPLGIYRQVSSNLHAYTATVDKIARTDARTCLYEFGGVTPFPLVNGPIWQWVESLDQFMQSPYRTDLGVFSDPFFTRIASPMARAWQQLKVLDKEDPDRYTTSLSIIEEEMPEGNDWKEAATGWIRARQVRNIGDRP